MIIIFLNILKIVISVIITVVFIFGICKVIKWDNEQEFKLGGNHTSVITEVDDTTTTIVETYKASDNSTVTYVVETTVTENNDSSTSITVALKRGGVVINSKTIVIPADDVTMEIEEELD